MSGLRRGGASQRRACWSVVVHLDRYSGVGACVPGLQRRLVLGCRGPLHVPADDGEGGSEAERFTDCTWRLRSCSTSVMSMHSGAVTNMHPGTVHHRGRGRAIEEPLGGSLINLYSWMSRSCTLMRQRALSRQQQSQKESGVRPWKESRSTTPPNLETGGGSMVKGVMRVPTRRGVGDHQVAAGPGQG